MCPLCVSIRCSCGAATRGGALDAMPWSIASVPPSYGEVDDTKLCRHIRVQRGIALDDLKRAVLKAFDDQ